MNNSNSMTMSGATRVARTLIGGAFWAILGGCGSPQLEIHQVVPSTIGARTADFRLSVFGAGLTPESRIVLGDQELPLVGQTPTSLEARVPGGTAGTTVPGDVSVSVKNPDGTRSNQLSLVVTEAPAPVLSSIDSPTCATYPATFWLHGANFTIDTSVEINGHVATITSLSSTLIWIRTPDGVAGEHDSLKVTVPGPGGGEASGSLYFAFLDCD